nr:Mov34/MPN/PAD-1 family protein [Oscillochloris sp. ZM17-4]
MNDLLRQMTHYHTAGPDDLVPERVGISYIWAGNGVFKYGRNVDTEVIVLHEAGSTPGLPELHPAVAWEHWPGRLPAALLDQVLAEARAALAPQGGDGPAGELLIPIEAQWLVVLDDEAQPHLYQPKQMANPSQVRYELDRRYLVDLHSHHRMAPFFSATDDRDDTWLSASVVVGNIFAQPTILCRLNVYGTRQMVPATLLFDGLGPFTDELDIPETDTDASTRAESDPWIGVLDALGGLADSLVAAGIDPIIRRGDARRMLATAYQVLREEMRHNATATD